MKSIKLYGSIMLVQKAKKKNRQQSKTEFELRFVGVVKVKKGKKK